jgi:hypothetical protein
LTILNKVEIIMRAILLFNNQCRCDQHMDWIWRIPLNLY